MPKRFAALIAISTLLGCAAHQNRYEAEWNAAHQMFESNKVADATVIQEFLAERDSLKASVCSPRKLKGEACGLALSDIAFARLKTKYYLANFDFALNWCIGNPGVCNVGLYGGESNFELVLQGLHNKRIDALAEERRQELNRQARLEERMQDLEVNRAMDQLHHSLNEQQSVWIGR